MTNRSNGRRKDSLGIIECGYSRQTVEVFGRFSVFFRRAFPDYKLDGTCKSERESTHVVGRPAKEDTLFFGKYSGLENHVFCL